MTLKICTELSLPNEFLEKAAVDAINENPENAPPLLSQSIVGVHISKPTLALITGKKWRRGRTLHVNFLGGSKKVHRKVRDYASRWEDYADIKFSFSPSEGDIRVSFVSGGSWSYVGTDALQISPPNATMNFGWLEEDTSEEEYERVVVHEFGHALGCIHEHQHPKAKIPWDRPKVYDYYKQNFGWDRNKVDHNVFRKYSENITNFSSYDSLSIMHYAIPNSLTIGDYEVGWNTTLSPTDKSFISIAY